ncbi:MAG: winged helix-turn-helix domain-containing protein [Acidobacteria bacterium]|nr:winged helix-turn-helix domain-containing protein [Acidobacteriota bacterium]
MNEISSAGTSRHVEPKMMRVLVCLAGRAGEVVTKEEIMAAVWPDTYVTEDVLLRCISELRRVLEDDARKPDYIQTIHGTGYRLIHPVTRIPQARAAETEALEKGMAVPALEVRARPVRRGLIGIVAAAVLTLALVGVYTVPRWFRTASPHRAGHTVLAVLPFDNLSGDPEQEFISDGLTEEMITELSRLDPDRLRVIARSSAMKYKGERKGVDQVGRELKADYVLEGSVRREDGRVRVTAQLVQVSDQTHVWAESFDREISGILALQGEVARLVAGHIRIVLTPGTANRLATVRPVNPDAYVEYLKGRRQWHMMTVAGFRRAGEHYKRAIELDPGYAAAWLGLADSYRMRGSWWGDLQAGDAFPVAKQTLERVMQIDDTIGEAYASLGRIRFVYDWDWAGAEAAFKRAIELAPNSRDAHSPYANFLRCMRRFDEARVRIERCLEIEPLSPLELVEASLLYTELGLPDRAEQALREALELDPESPPVLHLKTQSEARAGRLREAIQHIEEKGATTHPYMVTSSLLAIMYIRNGEEAKARAILKEMTKPGRAPPSEIAVVYRRLGDDAAYLDWLERAVSERDPSVVWLSGASAEVMGPVWDNPRFQAVLRQLNFPGGRTDTR